MEGNAQAENVKTKMRDGHLEQESAIHSKSETVWGIPVWIPWPVLGQPKTFLVSVASFPHTDCNTSIFPHTSLPQSRKDRDINI